MIPLPRREAAAVRRRERRRVLRAFDQLAETYVQRSKLHERTLPQIADTERQLADELKRMVCLLGGSE